MSQENVQLHSRANRAFNTRNVEAFVAFCDPQIELHSALTVPGGGIYHGHDGVRRWHRDLEDVFGGEIGIDPEVFFDLGEYTVTFHVLRGRGQQSGAGVATPAAHLCRWRDGRIIHFKGYVHREEVFSDLGIPKDAWKRSRPDELSELDTSAGRLRSLLDTARAMSQENVEIVRRIYRGFGDGTTDVHLWHTDAELRPAVFGGGLLEGTVYRGHEGLADFLAMQADTWQSVIAEPLTIRDLGTHLLVETSIQAVGRASGIQLSDVTWNLFEIRNGMVTSLRAFTTQQQALAAVGLSEQDAHSDS